MSEQVLPNGLTLAEEDKLVELLDKLSGDGMGTRVFDAYAPHGLTVAIEAVCLRLVKNRHVVDDYVPGQKPVVMLIDEAQVEVYMTLRPSNDTAYPNQYHCPGTVRRGNKIISKRETIADGFKRLEAREFGKKLSSSRWVAKVDHLTEERGHFVSEVYLCVLEDGPELKGKWFPVNQLPENTVACHRHRIIPAAFGVFAAENNDICR